MRLLRQRREAAAAPETSAASDTAAALETLFDEFLHFRGRLFVRGRASHPSGTVEAAGYRLPGQATLMVPGAYERRPDGDVFSFIIDLDDGALVAELVLVFALADGTTVEVTDFVNRTVGQEAHHRLAGQFFQMLESKRGGRILEVGSRNRSGNVHRVHIPSDIDYVGMDIVEGGNVDVVGDAHSLSTLFEPKSFDAIFAISTFEHLAMPWKVVLEMNAVLKPGGLVMIGTHQAWPLHEVPWDFWRFSDSSWTALFNESTGFEIVESAMGEPAAIVAKYLYPPTNGLDAQPAYLGSVVICRKTADTALRWDVDPSHILRTFYPA